MAEINGLSCFSTIIFWVDAISFNQLKKFTETNKKR